MATAEPARHALYSELQNVLTPESADTLMTYLPRDRSDEVATKSDIAALRSDMAEFKTEIRGDIKEMRDMIRSQQRFYVGTMVGSMMALTTIFSFVVG